MQDEFKTAYYGMNKKYTQAVAETKLFKQITANAIESIVETSNQYENLIDKTLSAIKGETEKFLLGKLPRHVTKELLDHIMVQRPTRLLNDKAVEAAEKIRKSLEEQLTQVQ